MALPLLAGQLCGGFALAQPAKGSGVINIEQRRQVRYDSYVLGPGDGLQIEVIDIPELSGTYSIGPDGTLYLPRLRAVYASGLTIETLRSFLTQQYTAFVKRPRLYVRPVAYRPIRVYVGGEVKRPGYYQLSGVTGSFQQPGNVSNQGSKSNLDNLSIAEAQSGNLASSPFSQTALPTVFDALRNAQGLTPFSDLRKVSVTRKLPEDEGGGKVRTELNFLGVITNGDESQNLRLFDGDVVVVAKSDEILRDQLLKAGQTNISPQFVQVFVSGRVKQPGPQILPQASTLNQALISAGGPKFLKGKVEFVRFTREGEVDRRIFNYNPGAAAENFSNPVLMAGDIIRVNESVLTGTLNVIDEVTTPFAGVFGTYALIKGVGGF
ncbi:polysaccharide biosynthesis/export family protein [Synechococcus lacustris]|uniref:polysaccharide biosynthesis/export family protein n=1 Tax=Synechococcus lacustris TaxID=2116544 RepID=UPI0020CD9855|nr:polysaccharide biosynthesis/export family protein [Synechococcus lacustris]MCP9812205.1 polysaccharide biosynthesis/export family protein [Synechococcus lacustris Maggiore-St4-Slac]